MKNKVAFDIDGTLIRMNDDGENVPRYDTLQLLIGLHDISHSTQIFVWSGSGVDYAKRWTERLGIHKFVSVIAKGSVEVDIAFDDEEVTLGKVNIQV